ncbi:MAG TPA: DUF1990 family protein [Acidimicrobiales bacterium]|nr:DUF1990 family protein [Acidimicrobiales bacterium]
MAVRRTLPHPLTTAALWPFGIALTSWQYMWRTTPLHRREHVGPRDEHEPPGLPAGVSTDDVQRPEDGTGALFHRRYCARISGARLPATGLLARLMADPDELAPTEFARFTKVQGEPGRMHVGDEYVVRMPGPWNGPVRVVEVGDGAFRLATLHGHLEAGQIEFRAHDDDGEVVFTIESWASSGDRLSKLLYQHLRMAKEVQFHMWTSVLENAARLAEGTLVGGIHVETVKVDEESTGAERLLGDPAARRVLDALHDRHLNFDPEERSGFTVENGWRIDHYCEPLGAEPPGPPVQGGTWEVACGLMRDYEFADPRIVRAVYYPDRPLEGRDMLLEGRFWGLRFHLGVRVGGVIDSTRTVDGREVRVWGWNYRTLAGHLEMGQMDYEAWKWLDTGEVEFRISAYSRRAPVPNPVIRLGLRVFGRREQVRFARHACERMERLTAEALRRPTGAPVPRTGDEVVARPRPAAASGPARRLLDA